jgi:hypothetical protein
MAWYRDSFNFLLNYNICFKVEYMLLKSWTAMISLLLPRQGDERERRFAVSEWSEWWGSRWLASTPTNHVLSFPGLSMEYYNAVYNEAMLQRDL